MLKVAVAELYKLTERITPVELNRAKNIVKMNILMALESSGARMEEIARNHATFGELNFHRYCEKIDKVTAEDVNFAASEMLKKPPTLVTFSGADPASLPDSGDVARWVKNL